MDVVWDLATSDSGSCSARDLRDRMPDLAYTTVITVLDRLVQKGMLERASRDRPHRYRPTGSQASYIVALMHEALATTARPSDALVSFVEMATPDQVTALRSGLGHEPKSTSTKKSVEESLA